MAAANSYVSQRLRVLDAHAPLASSWGVTADHVIRVTVVSRETDTFLCCNNKVRPLLIYIGVVLCLSPDGATADFILYTDPYHKQIYHSSMQAGSIQGVPVPDMEFPVSAAYDHGDERLYWLDKDLAEIRRARLDGDDHDLVLDTPKGRHSNVMVFALFVFLCFVMQTLRDSRDKMETTIHC